MALCAPRRHSLPPQIQLPLPHPNPITQAAVYSPRESSEQSRLQGTLLKSRKQLVMWGPRVGEHSLLSDGFAYCLTDEMKRGEEEEGQAGQLRERPLKDSSKCHIQMKKNNPLALRS